MADCGLACMCCLVDNIGNFKQPMAPKRRNLKASSSNKIVRYPSEILEGQQVTCMVLTKNGPKFLKIFV